MKTETYTRNKAAKSVGRISIDFEVANYVDLDNARRGLMPPDQVRRATIRGLVDSGATRLVLPGKIVKQLGLPSTGEITVTYANGETAKREEAAGVQVRLLGRQGIYTAIVEPKRRTALIGAIVLEDLDFLVDCTRQRLVPRDPRFEIHEIE